MTLWELQTISVEFFSIEIFFSIKTFDEIGDEHGDIVYSEFLSFILEGSKEQHLVDSNSILEKVSLVHDCVCNCFYKNGEKQVKLWKRGRL